MPFWPLPHKPSASAYHFIIYTEHCIDSLQSIPRESKKKDVAAILDELTIEANEESFVIVLQHGGNDVTWKRSS